MTSAEPEGWRKWLIIAFCLAVGVLFALPWLTELIGAYR